MSTLPVSRQDVEREFLSRLGATVQIDDSIVIDEPASGSSSSTFDGTSRATARDRLDLLLGLSSKESASVSASSTSCNDDISTFPSMCIFSPSSPPRSSSPTRLHQEVQDSASAEHVASTSLSRPVAYKREEVSSAPERLARSVTSSYSLLIQSNISAVTRKLNIRRGALPPIRIATVSTSFAEDFGNCNCNKDPKGRAPQDDGESTTKIRIGIDFMLSIDNALATFSAAATGSLMCHVSEDKSRGCRLDSVNLTVNGHQLLYSLRKQARVAALFSLMAAASANGGAIGGNEGDNNIHLGRAHDDDARPQPEPQRQEHYAGAAEPIALRCVSPEPVQIEDAKKSPCNALSESDARTEVGPLKRRRLGGP